MGTLSPKIDDILLPRRSADRLTCNRAPWLIEICELYGWHILNGIQPGPIACHTFHRGTDRSCIDLITSNTSTDRIECDPKPLKGLSDHTVLTTKIRTSFFNRYPANPHTSEPQISYKWIEGTGVWTYANSAKAWLAHTQTPEFTRGL